jgi:hypothetical protein
MNEAAAKPLIAKIYNTGSCPRRRTRVQFCNVAVGEAEAETPADGKDDDVGWQAEVGECRPPTGAGEGGFSCRQPRRSDTVQANATVPAGRSSTGSAITATVRME